MPERRVSEEAPAPDGARLQLALDAAHMGAWDWDPASSRLVADERMQAIYGMPPGCADGTYGAYARRVHPDDRASLERFVTAGIPRGSPWAVEHRVVRDDGTVRWVQVHGSVLRDAAGAVTRLIGTAMDVTERRVAQQRTDALVRLAQRVAAEADPSMVLQELVREVEALVQAETTVAYRWNPDRQGLETVGNTSAHVPQRFIPLGQGAVGRAVAERRPVIDNDYQAASAPVPSAHAFGVRAAIAVPLLHEGRLLGGLAAATTTARRFDECDAETLTLLGGFAALTLAGVERARLAGVLLAARTLEHELNNQLSLTVGYAELLANSSLLPPPLRPQAEEALRGARGAARTLARLHTVTRLQEVNLGGPGGAVLDLGATPSD